MLETHFDKSSLESEKYEHPRTSFELQNSHFREEKVCVIDNDNLQIFDKSYRNRCLWLIDFDWCTKLLSQRSDVVDC